VKPVTVGGSAVFC